MERELVPNKEIDRHTTLSELQKMLRINPDVFGDQLHVIKEAVEDAEAEIKEMGQLSQGTAEDLDNLHRPFKSCFLR